LRSASDHCVDISSNTVDPLLQAAKSVRRNLLKFLQLLAFGLACRSGRPGSRWGPSFTRPLRMLSRRGFRLPTIWIVVRGSSVSSWWWTTNWSSHSVLLR